MTTALWLFALGFGVTAVALWLQGYGRPGGWTAVGVTASLAACFALTAIMMSQPM